LLTLYIGISPIGNTSPSQISGHSAPSEVDVMDLFNKVKWSN